MNKTTYLSLTCAVLLIIGGLYYFFREEPQITEVPTTKPNPMQAGAKITFTGSAIIEEQNGRKVWELNAESIEADAGSKQVYLKNMKGTFYQDAGGKVEVTAREGILDTKTNDITLQGEMKVTSSEGAVFTAPRGSYAEQSKIFTGIGGIILTRGDIIITGDKIDADLKLEQVKIQGNAKVVTGGKN